MLHQSKITLGQPVTFPEWQGERLYMLPFTPGTGLPLAAKRFQGTVEAMLDGILVAPDQECYLMVDEKEVAPGSYHRRPGLHVDGYWNAARSRHGEHRGVSISCHGNSPRETHTPLPCPPGHGTGSAHGPQRWPGHQGPSHCAPNPASEGLLLASNYTAARALVGQYKRDFVSDWRGGDCSDLSAADLQEVILQANQAYHMDVMTLHESLPIYQPVRRTVVRINVPNWRN